MSKVMDMHEIVQKLTGSVLPTGDSSADAVRFNNLKNLVELTDKLLADIDAVSEHKDSYEHSVKKAGCYANDFLKQVKEQ